MEFVGRRKEIRTMQQALEKEENVVVTGPYGIGRTSLVKHLGHIMRDRWSFLFLDFSQTPKEICRRIAAGLGIEQKKEKRQTTKDVPSYKSIRFQITGAPSRGPTPSVFVLDNIARLSAPKHALIRQLTGAGRFRFVAIVERFLLERDLFLLRARLRPSRFITLNNLSHSEVQEFFHRIALGNGCQWTSMEVEALTNLCGGYPLRMREVAEEKFRNEFQRGPKKR